MRFGEVYEVWVSKNERKFRLVKQTEKPKFSMKLMKNLKFKVRAKGKCGMGKFSAPLIYKSS